MRTAVIISPNWKDYGHKYLKNCLISLSQQTHQADKVFLIDNQSSEESLNFLHSSAEELLNVPFVILTSQDNLGFAGGNNLAIHQALEENFEAIALFNMDGRLELNCLEKLITCLESDEQIGAAQARIMLYPETELVNSLGNATHYLGFGYCLGYRDKFIANKDECRHKEIFYPSGAAVIFRAKSLRIIGLFDEEYWMYNEDQDLGWRLHLVDLKVVLEPQAVFYHEYEFSRSVSKFYWMDRNRLITVLKFYHPLTLILLAPAFLLMELAMLAMAIKGGWLKEKLKVWSWFLKPKSWVYLRGERQFIQSLRRVPDRWILRLAGTRIEYQELESPSVKLGNLFFELYWRIVKPLIIW